MDGQLAHRLPGRPGVGAELDRSQMRTLVLEGVVMLRKPLGLLGIFLIVVGIGHFVGAGVAYSKVQDGYESLQSFSEAQNVELSYNDDGDLVDRDTVEGAQAIRSLLADDWVSPSSGPISTPTIRSSTAPLSTCTRWRRSPTTPCTAPRPWC